MRAGSPATWLLLGVTLGLGTLLGLRDRRPHSPSADLLTFRRALLAEEERGSPIAAFGLQLEGSDELLYLRAGGRWRCASAFGAPARGQDVQVLLDALLGARGLVRSGPGAPREEQATLRLGLFGPGVLERPDRDLVAELELFPLTGGRTPSVLARASGGPWLELPLALPPELIPGSDSGVLPPLLDDRLVASAWTGDFPGLERAFVDRADGSSIELRPRGQEPRGQEPRGQEPGSWLVTDSSQDSGRPVLPYRLNGFLNYLLRARFVGLADPRTAGELGLDRPLARLTLELTGGQVVQLAVGRPVAAGSFVLREEPRMLVQVGEADAAWLTPDADMLADGERTNPWERWLIAR